MAEMDVQQKMTADDLLNLPDDGKRYELIEGELVEMAPTGYEHGFSELNVGYYVRGFLKKNPIGRAAVGEVGFYTRKETTTVRAADVVYISFDRLPKDQDLSGYLTIAPDLVVEVISPNDRTGDIDSKTQEWLGFGVRMVWNVYPARKQVHIYTPDSEDPRILFADDTLEGGDVLPGFRVTVSELFED